MERSAVRLERGALVLFVAGRVAAAGRWRIVLLTLQVLGDGVARELHPTLFCTAYRFAPIVLLRASTRASFDSNCRSPLIQLETILAKPSLRPFLSCTLPTTLEFSARRMFLKPSLPSCP